MITDLTGLTAARMCLNLHAVALHGFVNTLERDLTVEQRAEVHTSIHELADQIDVVRATLLNQFEH